VKYLTHSCIVQVVDGQRILRLGNLLRGSPTGYPYTRIDRRGWVSAPPAAAYKNREAENRKEFPCMYHRSRFTIRPK